MKGKIYTASRKGFTAIEVVLAVGIITLLGVLTSRFLLAATRSLIHSNQHQKVNSLANMVFEQYNSYTVVNYNVLQIYNQPVPVAPKVFFGTTDDFGYDGMKLKTQSLYAMNHTTCSITVTISWVQEGQIETKVFTKTYAETPPLEGGTVVDVYVRPCDTCEGYPDFKISATPSVGTTPIIGLTDVKGHAVLRGVKIAPSIPISAEKLPGGWGGWPNLPFAQGYYAPDGAGGYVYTVTHSLNIQRLGTNQTIFSEFRPFGKVTGHLKNISTLLPEEKRVDNMAIVFFGKVGFSDNDWGTHISQCGPDRRCYLYTDASGHFTINNVVPGTVYVAVEGTSPDYMNSWSTGESAPEVQPTLPGGATNPDFKWGFVGAPYYNTIILNAATPPTKQDPPMAFLQGTSETDTDIEFPINRKGWFDVSVTREGTNEGLGGAVVSASINKGAWGEDNWPHLVASGGDGHSRLYNMYNPAYYPTPLYYKFSATRNADASYSNLYHPWQIWNCDTGNCLDRPNSVVLAMDPTYTLEGQLSDPSNPANTDSVIVKLNGQYGDVQISTANAAGHFTFPAFAPEFFNPDASGNPQWITLKLSKTLSIPNHAILQGSMVDTATGKHIPVNGITVGVGSVTGSDNYLPGANSAVPASGPDGQFSIQVALPDWGITSPEGLPTTCHSDTRLCQLNSDVAVNMQVGEVELRQAPVNLGWEGTKRVTIVSGVPSTGIIWNMNLVAQPIKGKITGSNSLPMPGIRVDGMMQLADDLLRCHYSDANGDYVWDAFIDGRDSTHAGVMRQINAPGDRTDMIRQWRYNVPVPDWTGPLAPAFLAGEGFVTLDFQLFFTWEDPGGGGGGDDIHPM